MEPIAYRRYDYPWFDLYDEQIPAITSTGRFNNIQSIRQLDTLGLPSYSVKPAPQLLNPKAPPPCSTHDDAKACVVLRPCGHFACVTCFGQAMMNGSKCGVLDCDKIAEALIGFEKPVAKVNVGGGSMGKWWTFEDQIDGIAVGETDGRVVTLFLDEDCVSRLHGKNR